MSIHDDSNWLTYETAASATVGDGIGLVLNGDGLVCIDLDDCVVNGKLNAEAQALIASLPKTFTEFSPSGRGVHIWGYANFKDGRRFQRNGLKVEIYGTGRYITVTGRPIVKAGLAPLNLETLLT
jgi:primase-polymerase (primpol)-like protein